MKYIKTFDEFLTEQRIENILEGKDAVYNGMTLDELVDKCVKFKGSDKRLLQSLIKVLSNTDYTKNYIDLLNELLDDKRVRRIMSMGFGGKWADIKIDISMDTTAVTGALHPTQNEIDLVKSLKFSLNDFAGSDGKGSIYHLHNKPFMLKNTPIVTFNGKYIIDGHHRWSQFYCFNRVCDGKPTKCGAINFSNKSLEPIDILKITQTTLALDTYPKEIKSEVGNDRDEYNLLSNKCSKNFILKYIRENIVDGVYKQMIEYHRGDGVTTNNDVVEFILNNCLEMRKSNKCISDAPNREIMPQTDDDEDIFKNLRQTSDIS